MDIVTPMKKVVRGTYQFVTKPREARIGRYEELCPELYTSITSSFPEVDPVSDESMNSSFGINRSQEDKGIQSDPILHTRARTPKSTPHPTRKIRKRKPSGIEGFLRKLGLPGMDAGPLFALTIVIMGVLYATIDGSTSKVVEPTAPDFSTNHADQMEVEKTVIESEAKHDDYLKLGEEINQQKEYMQSLSSQTQNQIKELQAKLSQISSQQQRVADQGDRIAEIIARMENSMQTESSRLEALSEKLEEKEKAMAKLRDDLNYHKNITLQKAESEATSNAVTDRIIQTNQKLDQRLKALEEQLGNFELETRKSRSESSTKAQELISKVFEDSVESIKEKLNRIMADKTGMADFALESAGAEIATDWTSRGLASNAAMVKIWNVPIFYHTVSARAALQPDVNPGNCFAFGGAKGTIGVKLSRSVVVQNVTIEHIPKEISLDGSIVSAPRDFKLYGVSASERVDLGKFVYNINGNPIQTFRVDNELVYDTVQFAFETNWGAEHTCIYRVRVHGSH